MKSAIDTHQSFIRQNRAEIYGETGRKQTVIYVVKLLNTDKQSYREACKKYFPAYH